MRGNLGEPLECSYHPGRCFTREDVKGERVIKSFFNIVEGAPGR